jgi:hypothetical protein
VTQVDRSKARPGSAGAPKRRLLPLLDDGHAARVSPDWVRISTASALALRFTSGRFQPPPQLHLGVPFGLLVLRAGPHQAGKL